MKVGHLRTLVFGGVAVLALGVMPGGIANGGQAASGAVDGPTARAVFERIKKLEGTWHSRSTKGWEENAHYRVFAKGSAVSAQSIPADNTIKADTQPTAPMLTVFHMDGDRLMLTHYCEAGNQPRMVATSVEEGGRTVHFAFLDATNLKSPSAGHMHSAVLTFADPNHFTERWSWYQNGTESWMEEVQNERVSP
jgi:hypothetical protein